MPDDEFAEVAARRDQSVFIGASAASVVVVVALVALVVHPWRDTAGRSVAVRATTPAASSDSPLTSPATSPPAVNVNEPAFSAAPVTSAPATNGPSAAQSTTPVSHRTSATPADVPSDNQPNFKVSIQVAPTDVVMGQRARVTVTIVNQGGVLDRQVVMAMGGSDPSDNFSDAQSPCTDSTGSLSCPISDVRPGRTWSFTFTFIPGPFPGMDGYDDPISALFDYTDNHGQPQQSPQFFANVRLFDAPTSAPPASGTPSNTPPPSASPASAASTSATSAPASAI